MKSSRFSQEQIIGILKQGEAGVKVTDLCRQHGISDHTYYRWKSKFGGMEVSEAKRRCHLRLLSGYEAVQECAGGERATALRHREPGRRP